MPAIGNIRANRSDILFIFVSPYGKHPLAVDTSSGGGQFAAGSGSLATAFAIAPKVSQTTIHGRR
jgi:hypothetical protein